MDEQLDLSSGERVARLLHHLGIERAHFVQGAAEAAAHPEVVASLALVTPAAQAAEPLRALAAHGGLAVPPLVAHGEHGPRGTAAPLVLAAYPGASASVLRDYTSMLWSDVAADRTAEIGTAMLAHLAEADRRAALPAVDLPEGEGEVAGITYRARGSGPPLLLFPLDLAPSQWEPLLPALAARYCTLTLGGAWLGAVAILEQRACGGYGALVDTLLDALALPTGGAVLEAGCGSGAVARRLARRVGADTTIVALDVNAHLLREAATLAQHEGLGGRIEFREGSAEGLPFPDASFDVALSCTVLEEVDGDRALAELVRVVRPGGRVGVVVRAEDLPPWDSLPLRPDVRAKVAGRPGAGAAARGCADASLYRRFRATGLADGEMGPRLAVDLPGAGLRDWQAFREGTARAVLNPAEVTEWQAAAAQATADGSYLWATPYHCAVGTKP